MGFIPSGPCGVGGEEDGIGAERDKEAVGKIRAGRTGWSEVWSCLAEGPWAQCWARRVLAPALPFAMVPLHGHLASGFRGTPQHLCLPACPASPASPAAKSTVSPGPGDHSKPQTARLWQVSDHKTMVNRGPRQDPKPRYYKKPWTRRPWQALNHEITMIPGP